MPGTLYVSFSLGRNIDFDTGFSISPPQADETDTVFYFCIRLVRQRLPGCFVSMEQLQFLMALAAF